jgi:uncharacterized protein YdeI (BOF family)
VILSGTITQILGDFNFMLGDGTDEVFVDGDDDFGALAVGDAILVTGIVDVEDSPPRVEIEATAVVRKYHPGHPRETPPLARPGAGFVSMVGDCG